jgi:hypothetical protein
VAPRQDRLPATGIDPTEPPVTTLSASSGLPSENASHSIISWPHKGTSERNLPRFSRLLASTGGAKYDEAFDRKIERFRSEGPSWRLKFTAPLAANG